MQRCFCTAMVVLPLVLAAANARAVDLENHVPHFTWRTTTSGEHWIYDGELPVGAFYAGTEPIGSIARPISLHNLRLLPGGPVFIAAGEGCGPLCLSWRKHLIFQPVIDQLKVDDRDPRRLTLYVRTHDAALRADQPREPAYEPNNVVEETWLELTYDAELPSYVFDVRTRVTIRPGRAAAMFARDFRGLEFGDILPAGCNARFPPYGNKRYQWYVYKGRDGQLYKLPHNHSNGPERRGILYAKDGFMAFLLEPDYNPVVHFVGDSALHVFSEICWAMYDVHFKFVRSKQIELVTAEKPLEVHYRVYSISQAEAKRMLEQAAWDPKLDDPAIRAPLYATDGVNHFEPSDEYRRPTDAYCWQASDANCTWDWTTGYRSKGSLTIGRSTEQGASRWLAERALRELRVYDLKAPFTGRYRIRAMVRTKEVTGAVRLGWTFLGATPAGPRKDRRPQYSTRQLRGTNDWTELILETSPGAPAAGARVFLEQQGAGQCWFDDVEIRPVW